MALNVDQLIARLGGNSRLGRRLGIQPHAVAHWRHTGLVPPRHALAILRLCREARIEAESVLPLLREAARSHWKDDDS